MTTHQFCKERYKSCTLKCLCKVCLRREYDDGSKTRFFGYCGNKEFESMEFCTDVGCDVCSGFDDWIKAVVK